MSTDELLNRISGKLKKPLTEKDVFADEIKLSTLKKIDAIFNKGLSYYVDPQNLERSREESIFFRKDNFNADLSLGAKQIVSKYEEEKIRFSALAKRADFRIKRMLPVYRLSSIPKSVAMEVRQILYPAFVQGKRAFLKGFIEKLADYNVLVYEFVEPHNKAEKANIDGFFLTPNVIVLKRAQKYFSREIFTLAHELAHYLLNEEDIDDKVYEDIPVQNKIGHVETWCNEFAYYFLAGDYDLVLSKLEIAGPANDYHTDLIRSISEKTHLSSISLYTRLLLNQQISYVNYDKVKNSILQGIQEREQREKEKLEEERQKLLAMGKTPMPQQPKPILSPLLVDTMRSALDLGLINEYEFCKRLAIKPERIEEYYA